MATEEPEAHVLRINHGILYQFVDELCRFERAGIESLKERIRHAQR